MFCGTNCGLAGSGESEGSGLRRLRPFFAKKVLRTPKNLKNVFICRGKLTPESSLVSHFGPLSRCGSVTPRLCPLPAAIHYRGAASRSILLFGERSIYATHRPPNLHISPPCESFRHPFAYTANEPYLRQLRGGRRTHHKEETQHGKRSFPVSR